MLRMLVACCSVVPLLLAAILGMTLEKSIMEWLMWPSIW